MFSHRQSNRTGRWFTGGQRRGLWQIRWPPVTQRWTDVSHHPEDVAWSLALVRRLKVVTPLFDPCCAHNIPAISCGDDPGSCRREGLRVMTRITPGCWHLWRLLSRREDPEAVFIAGYESYWRILWISSWHMLKLTFWQLAWISPITK